MYGDISAFLHDERKGYSGVGWQQGRILTDADFNADQDITAARNEALFRQIICPAASPDDGFRLSAPTLQTVTLADNATIFDTYDFQLAAGNFVIGGLRLRRGPDSGSGFLEQSEWLLQTDDSANYPPAPTDADLAARPSGRRTDLAYLDVIEQLVRAVEDREIQDSALGAADTTTRRRPLGRVRVLADVPDDCSGATDALRNALVAPYPGDGSGVPHAFSDDGVELLSKARLTVSFSAAGAPTDPCQPREIAGYIGAENQTLKVMLTAANRLVFAIDHGEPLYRVQLSPDPNGQRVTFLTTPRDPVLFPVAGQVIEILPWAALLPNGEKTADARGHLAAIVESYDPETRSVVVNPPVDPDWITWLANLPAGTLSPHDEPQDDRYFYARIWQPQATGAGPDTPFDTLNPVVLTDLGVELHFHALGIPGDFWTISLRTAAPALVLPWRLMEPAGAAPMGPRRFYAGLGLIRWDRGQNAGDPPVGSVHDCREHLHRLCEIGGCCTLTVGDGHSSHGVIDDLQAAIESLPDTGGEICLLPGRHLAAATIVQPTMVTVHGCGLRTVVTHAAGQTDPVLSIRGGSHIALRDFAVETDGVVGVEWRLAPERVELARLQITAGGGRAVNGPTGTDVTIEDCRFIGGLFAEPLTEETVGALRHLLVLGGDGIIVRRNRLTVAEGRATQQPLGGMQIVGDSRNIIIKDNLIAGGNGFGIVLGSYSLRPEQEMINEFALAGEILSGADERGNGGFLGIAEDGCPEIDPDPPGGGGDGDGNEVPVSDGNVEDVLIDRNRILGMGLSGISVVLWMSPFSRRLDAIETNRCVIEDNEIRDCVRLNLGANLSESLRQHAAFGGITLADAVDLVVSRNRIEGCGTSSSAPVCGVFVRSGEELEIAENTILDNGIIADAGTMIRPGRAGGIVIGQVTSNLTRGSVRALSDRGPQNRGPALKVHGNRVLAREGRALSVSGFGPMAIADNTFASYGANTLMVLILILLSSRFGDRLTTGVSIDPDEQIKAAAMLDALVAAIAGTTVTVINLGISQEGLFLGQVNEWQAGTASSRLTETSAVTVATKGFVVGGEILFNDNQVTFDALSQGITLSLCSVLLLTLDDISMSDNQCVIDANFDFVAIDAMVVGLTSVRMQGNRFQESPFRTFLSALTLGIMNATQNNQGTHCFAIIGTLLPQITVGGVPMNIDTNRHLVPEFWCSRRGVLTNGVNTGFPTIGQHAAYTPTG